MEFDEIQKAWATEQQQFIYTINEKAMHQYIMSRRRSVLHTTNFTEWLTIIANVIAGSVLVIKKMVEGNGLTITYVIAAIMFLTAAYVAWSRHHRKMSELTGKKNMMQDLDDAIKTASYQVRLSQLLRWYGGIVALLVIFSFWNNGKSMVIIGGVALFFVVMLVASRWEHKWYVRRKEKLEKLKENLENG